MQANKRTTRYWMILALMVFVTLGAGCGYVEGRLEGLESQVAPQTSTIEAVETAVPEVGAQPQAAHSRQTGWPLTCLASWLR